MRANSILRLSILSIFCSCSAKQNNFSEIKEPYGPEKPSKPGISEESLSYDNEEANLPTTPSSPIEASESEKNFVRVCVKVSQAELRDGPSSKAKVIKMLKNGECFDGQIDKVWTITKNQEYIRTKDLVASP